MYHALLAGLQALLAEDYAGALTIAAAPAFIALLPPGNQSKDPDLQRLRRQAVQLLNQIRGTLTLHEQMVVPPLFVEAAELTRRAAKSLPPRVIAFVTQLNANAGAVTDEDLNRLQIRGTESVKPSFPHRSRPGRRTEATHHSPSHGRSQSSISRSTQYQRERRQTVGGSLL